MKPYYFALFSFLISLYSYSGNCYSLTNKYDDQKYFLPPKKKLVVPETESTSLFDGFHFYVNLQKHDNENTKIIIKTREENDGKITFTYNSKYIAYFVYKKAIKDKKKSFNSIKKIILQENLHNQIKNSFDKK